MTNYRRSQPSITRQSDENSSEDYWLNEFEKKLAVQPADHSVFDQISSIMNSKSKYPNVEAAVNDMKERSGFSAFIKELNKTSDTEEENTKTAAPIEPRWYMEYGIQDGKEDLETHGFGSDILSSILARNDFGSNDSVPPDYDAWMEYAKGYIQGSEMKPESQSHELDRIKHYLHKHIKKATDQNRAADKKDLTPLVIKKCPNVKSTLENYIRDTKGNLPISAIIDKIKSIHRSDVSEAKDWDDDKLLRLVSQMNLEAKKNNPGSYENYSNLGRRDMTGDSEIDPSNRDAFYALNPAKM
jgi:hypothetical protein